jgi:hypothetical protein
MAQKDTHATVQSQRINNYKRTDSTITSIARYGAAAREDDHNR